MPKTFPFQGRWFFVVIALIVLAVSALPAWGAIASTEDIANRIGLFCFAATIAASGAWLLLRALRGRTVLSQDGIGVTGAFTTRRFTAAQIRGYRRNRMQLLFVPTDPAAWPVTVDNRVMSEAKHLPWLAALKDVVPEDRARIKAMLLADERFGATPAERRAFIAKAKAFARYSVWAAFAIAIWVFFKPEPYTWAIAAAALAPLIALAVALYYVPLFAFADNDNNKGPQPNLLTLLAVPALALLGRAAIDIDLLDWWPAVVAAIASAAALTYILMQVPALVPRLPGAVFVLAVIVAAYVYGAVAEADMLLESGAAQKFTTIVKDKRISGGRSHSYDLQLAPWGPETNPAELSVSYSLYSSVKVGDTVCVFLNRGALGLRWFVIQHCPAQN